MRTETEIRARIDRWNKVKLSEFKQQPVATVICELQWILGDAYDVIQANEDVRTELKRLSGVNRTLRSMTQERNTSLDYYIVRPRWDEIRNPGAGVVGCSCGESLWTVSELRDHWQMGHFDYVVNPAEPVKMEGA